MATQTGSYDFKAAKAVQTNLDNMEVGGRNLLRNSGTFDGWLNTTDVTVEDGIETISVSGETSNKYRGLYGHSYLPYSDLVGKNLIISFEVYSDDWASVDDSNGTTGLNAVGFQLNSVVSMTSIANNSAPYFLKRLTNTEFWCEVPTVANSKWLKFVSRPFVLPDAFTSNVSNPLNDYITAMVQVRRNGTVKVRKLKLEVGNVATDWTPAPEDADAAIETVQANLDNLEIGGRNLALESAGEYEKTKTSDSATMIGGRHPLSDYGKEVCVAGATVLVSCDAKVSSGTHVVRPYLTGSDLATKHDTPKACSFTTVWKRCTWTITLTDSVVNWQFTASSGSGTNGTTYYVRNIKIETGDKATGWTPAPEDLEAAIEEAAAVAGNYIIETASNDVWIHSEDHGPNSSGVATADTYGWRIGSVFELVRAGASYMKMWVENSVAKVRVGLENAGHSVFSSSGMEVFTDASTSVASFGSTSRLGNASSSHIEQSSSSTTFYGSDGTSKLVKITTVQNLPQLLLDNEMKSIYASHGGSIDGVNIEDLFILSNGSDTERYGEVNIKAVGFDGDSSYTSTTTVRVSSMNQSGADLDIGPTRITTSNRTIINNTAEINRVYTGSLSIYGALEIEYDDTKPGSLSISMLDTAAFRNAFGASSGIWPASLGGTGQTSLQATRNAMGLGNTTGALPVANGGTAKTSGAFHAATDLYNVTAGSDGTITLSSSVVNFDYLDVWTRTNNNTHQQVTRVYARKAAVTTTIVNFEASSNTGTLIRRTRYAISGTSMTPSYGNYMQNTAPSTWTSGTAGTNYIKVTRVIGYVI